jgi:glycosyltransferase involved in cell wall biosynthesis
MACGLPCVASRVSGSTDLIRDGETGVLFGVDDATELAAAVAGVEGEAGQTLGDAARRFVAEGYDIERIAERYEALYRRLMADTGGVVAGADRAAS